LAERPTNLKRDKFLKFGLKKANLITLVGIGRQCTAACLFLLRLPIMNTLLAVFNHSNIYVFECLFFSFVVVV